MRETDRLDLLERASEDFGERLARLEAKVAVQAVHAPGAPSSPVAAPVFAVPATAQGAKRADATAVESAPESMPRPEATFARASLSAAKGPSVVGAGAAGREVAAAPVAGAAVADRPKPPSLEEPPSREESPSLEDVLGGRVLAWAGGCAVLVGIVLLFAIAVTRGWIGEEARTLFGALGSAGLVIGGSWLHERRGRTDASLAAVAAGLAGLFVTVVVAARVYELIPAGPGIVLALAAGALSTSLALRWRVQELAALGILGALLAPVLVDAPQDGATTALLFAAALSAAAVCVHARWDWLALVAAVTVTPQWVGYLLTDPGRLAALFTLVGFGAVAAAGAVGFDLRMRSAVVRPASVLLLTLNAFLLAVVGWLALDQSDPWLVALAGVHLAAGAVLLRRPQVSHAVGVLAVALGAVLADLALARLLDGVALTIGWAFVAVAFAGLVRHVRTQKRVLDDVAAGAGLAAHIALALLNAVFAEAPPSIVAAGGALNVGASGSLAALAAACLAAGLVLADRPGWRRALHGLGLAATAYLLAANLEGASLVAAWAAQGVVLAGFARRTSDRFALDAALAHVALAGAHAITIEAPPFALLYGLANPLAAVIAVGACAVAAARCAYVASQPALATTPASDDTEPRAEARRTSPLTIQSATAAALLALYLASTLLVTAAGAGPRAQTLLSVLWGAVGVAALVGGLLRDVAPLRTGALTLLLAALAKVFLYDLAALTPIARVVSFIVLGLLLLLGAFAWQRIRPRSLPDLREAAPVSGAGG